MVKIYELHRGRFVPPLGKPPSPSMNRHALTATCLVARPPPHLQRELTPTVVVVELELTPTVVVVGLELVPIIILIIALIGV